MTGPQAACPNCATLVAQADRFCESCGAPLVEVPEPEVSRVAIPRTGQAAEGPCSDCGNSTFTDEYCTGCGHRRAEPDRDEALLGAMALITDRGLHHARNEDAAAAGIVSDAVAVVVCDGVSTSGEAQLAAVAASKAGVDGMVTALAASKGARAAVLAGLADAAKAAVDVGLGGDSATAPSCTYTAATVVPTSGGAVEITVGNVGDSRAYWLPDPPAVARQLTVDDSVAQELMTAGAAADSELVQRGAHTLTRWLGADSEPTPWAEESVQTITVVGPGSLLLCSDGLWNYLPDPADIARFCTGTDPAGAARALTEFALKAGGHDNITVAVIPIGGAT
jgi:serine/threonine protein phosphatase PrpC